MSGCNICCHGHGDAAPGGTGEGGGSATWGRYEARRGRYAVRDDGDAMQGQCDAGEDNTRCGTIAMRCRSDDDVRRTVHDEEKGSLPMEG